MKIPVVFRNQRLVLPAVILLLILLLVGLYLIFRQGDQIPKNDRFGLVFISPADDLADEARYEGALASGVGWDRWPLYWHWVAEGGYSGDHQAGNHDYDQLVVDELNLGITPLVILMGTPVDLELPGESDNLQPRSQTDLPLQVNPPTLPPASLAEPIFSDESDDFAPNKQINSANAWAMFVFTSVERYRPGGLLAQEQGWTAEMGVRHWEVWNEPDFQQFWSGSIADYYRLLEVAYKSIKLADPEAVVLSGGLAFYEQPNWLGQLLRQMEGDPSRRYFDVLAVHHYWSIYGSEARLSEARATLDAYELTEIPIWLTESGLSVWDDFPATIYDVSPETPGRGTMAEQAAYVIQHPTMVLYNDVERYFHFMLHDDCGDGLSTAFGLRQNFEGHICNPAKGQARPAYAAYQLVTEQFRDLRPLWRRREVDQDQFAFYRPDDQTRLVVLWSTQGFTTTATVRATGPSARLYWIEDGDIVGNSERRRTVTVRPANGLYRLQLPPATNRKAADSPDARYNIGGRPYLLIEPDQTPPEATVNRIAPLDSASYLVRWQGQDAGSDIGTYTVWVAQDDGPFEPWLIDTPDTRAEYGGEAGSIYHFAVNARDRAGNESPVPAAAQASTDAFSTTTVSGLVLGPAGQPVPESVITFAGADIQRDVRVASDGTFPSTVMIPGEYTVQARAPGYGAWPAPRLVTVDADRSLLLTLAPSENVVIAGDFEGNDVWRHWEWAGQVDSYFVAFDGQYSLRLGRGIGEEMRCPSGKGQRWMIQQQVTVPTTPEPVLSFVHQLAASQADPAEAWLEVVVVSDGRSQPLSRPADFAPADDWQLTTFDLAAWSGQTVELTFAAVRCSDRPFEVLLDRISLGSSP